jgi:hypothetical protein
MAAATTGQISVILDAPGKLYTIAISGTSHAMLTVTNTWSINDAGGI